MEQKISTQHLELYMFVARLDRPWIETPFPLQGLYVTSPEEIRLLQEHCHYVYIDRQRAEELRGKNKSIAAHKGQTADALPAPRTVYEDVVSVEEEISKAKEARVELSESLQALREDFRRGQKLHVLEIKEAVGKLMESVLRNPDAFMWLRLLKERDSYSYLHCIDVSALSVAFGRQLGFPKAELRQLALGALLCDVGKMKLPEELLAKQGPLSDKEMSLVKQHVKFGVELMEQAPNVPKPSLEIVAYHHERFDGSGYPYGLQGHRIPMFARMAAVADCYDAITSDRPYASAISPHEAVRKLHKWGGVDFQPELVEKFIQTLGVYPIGTLVELSTGDVGIVTGQNLTRRLRPKVMVVMSPDRLFYEPAPVVDLLQVTTDDDGNSLEITRTLEPGSYGIRLSDYYL